ncbi:hypothetical protein [Natronorubrum daqingense]|nr:hypothetical protein [Natronorubrum daqingense]
MSDAGHIGDTGCKMVRVFEDMGVSSRPAEKLAEKFETESHLVDYIVNDGKLTDFSGVGDRSASHVRTWFVTEYPEKERERKQHSESYCTEFTTDHGIPEDEKKEPSEPYWAWICPRCSNKNPMYGHPNGFKNRPYACTTCRWVSALDAESIDEWLENCTLQPKNDHQEDGHDE